MSSNYSDLHKAAAKNFLLDGNKFANLTSLIGITEYRVYCIKPYHGRTNHAKFSSTNPNSLPLFNYATGVSSFMPSNLCNALSYMLDDNSKARALSCYSLKPYAREMNERLYNFIWYAYGQTFINVMHNSSMFCDDFNTYKGVYNNYGTWMFYVK